MSQFLNKVRDVDPNDSDSVKESLSAFFQNLSKHKDVDCNRWLRTLENAINRFPKYCGQHRATIENYLCHFLDSNNYYNVIEAAKCAHAIQQVRPQQEKTASAKTCWRDQMSALCEAAHTLIDALFMKSTSIYSKNGKTQKSDSQSITSPLRLALVDIEVVTKSNDVANKSAILCTRLKNLLVFIQAMLVEIYPVAKPVRPQLILEVLLHALGASGNEDSTKVTTVKIQALRTLDALVACLGSNLIPFSALVFRFVMQTLRWSSEHNSEETRQVRCAAYSSLTKWLSALHAHRDTNDSTRSWDSELTSHIVADVTPPKHVIQLTPNAQPMKNLSKKARKKLANSLLMQSNIYSHSPGEKNKLSMSEESNDVLAIAALECAEAFLTTCGIFLKPTIHKQFQEMVVRECYALNRYSIERGVWLLRALEACRKGISSRVPPPTQYCLQLYSGLLSNPITEISKFASQALLDIRLHLHCSPPSLGFSLEPPERKNRDDKRKRLSDRNRAVLESLLGQERMPSEDLTEQDIITIPDEPSSKKPRIEENSDQISLSSESGASIEITDSSSVEEVEELDDSADYIIEPSAEMEKDLELQDKDLSNKDLTDTVEQIEDNDVSNKQIDETDGKVKEGNGDEGINDDDDADTIKLSQVGPSSQDDPSQNIVTQDKPSEDDPSQDNLSQNIFEAKTQLPDVSVDSNENNRSPTPSPLSIEVAYDYPNTGQETVKILEIMDVDNLPSTNETDDIQITCGQTVKSSQEDAKEIETNEVPKENGVEKSPERIVENGDASNEDIEDVASKIVPNEAAVTVEDMLADFVDEVNDESQTQITV